MPQNDVCPDSALASLEILLQQRDPTQLGGNIEIFKNITIQVCRGPMICPIGQSSQSQRLGSPVLMFLQCVRVQTVAGGSPATIDQTLSDSFFVTGATLRLRRVNIVGPPSTPFVRSPQLYLRRNLI
jgi:hypothetical protein